MEEIAAQHADLRASVVALAASDPQAAHLEATLALHERLGEIWMWMKERR